MGGDEDELVQLLRVAAGDMFPDPADAAAAHEAGTWLTGHGWRWHDRLGFVHDGKAVAFRADFDDEALVVVRNRGGMWQATGVSYPVADFRAALNTLAVLGFLPAQFSTLGREALEDLAVVHERVAELLYEQADLRDGEPRRNLQRQGKAMLDAAASARRYGGGGLPDRVPA